MLSSEIIDIPIFPLSNVVFFPNTLLPLHIFEDRYCRMVSESLDQERRIGMVLVKPGGDSGKPLIPDHYSIGSLGVISDYKELEDGEFDIMLSGVCRFRILSLVTVSPYITARVSIIDEDFEQEYEDEEALQELLTCYRQLTKETGVDENLLRFLEDGDFPTVVNALCSSLPIAAQDKQSLLELDSIRNRAEEMLSIMGVLLDQRDLVSHFRHLRPDDPSKN